MSLSCTRNIRQVLDNQTALDEVRIALQSGGTFYDADSRPSMCIDTSVDQRAKEQAQTKKKRSYPFFVLLCIIQTAYTTKNAGPTMMTTQEMVIHTWHGLPSVVVIEFNMPNLCRDQNTACQCHTNGTSFRKFTTHLEKEQLQNHP